MVRRRLIAFAVLCAALVPGAGFAAPQRSFDELTASAIVISDHTGASFQLVRDAVEASGARGLQMFPPDAIFGYFSDRPSPSLAAGIPVAVCFTRDELAGTGLDPIVEKVVGDLLEQDESFPKAAAAAGSPLGDVPFEDVMLRGDPNLIRAATPSGPRRGAPMEITDRGPQQNSEFMIGSVLINVIFPESKGGDENWTDQEIADALSAMSLGLSQYVQRALWVDLSFMYNYRNFKRVPVSMEPIESSMGTDPIWMGEALAELGYHDGAYMGAHELNNHARDSLKTEWVFTAFIADMSNHYNPDPPSPDPGCWGGAGYVAYSYLGGPYLLVPYPACRYGYGLGFGRVFIHEMSHTFWALDEYESAGVSCNDKSGYLAIPNRNTLFQPCIETVPCIMQTASPPFSEPQPICEYTQGQVGLYDEKDEHNQSYPDNIPDIYDVAPTVEFLNVPGITSDTLLPGEAFLLSVRARNGAVPNTNPQEDPAYRVSYAPYIKSGEISINGQPYEDIKPSDGKWNSANELIAVELQGGFDPGVNTIKIRVKNRVELGAEATKSVFVIGLRYFNTSATAENGAIRIGWTTAAEVFGADFDVIRSDLSAGELDRVIGNVAIADEEGTDRRGYSFLDTDVLPGHEYRYRVNGKFTIDFRGEIHSYEFPSGEFVKTAVIPIEKSFVSNLLPNPTTGRTSFTVDVPRSYRDMSGSREPAGSGAAAAPASIEVRTRVEINVYNVAGQRVRNIYADSRFGGVTTFTWDGADTSGRLVPSGVYFLQVKAGNDEDVRKIVILR
jgi:hypothetical protein